MKKYMLLFFAFLSFSSFSQTFTEEELVEMFEMAIIDFGNKCPDYKGELSPSEPHLKPCRLDYLNFFYGFEFYRQKSLDSSGKENKEFIMTMNKLWDDNKNLCKNKPLLRSTLATVIVRLEPKSRPYLADTKLEELAYLLLESDEATHQLKVNGLTILSHLGKPRYIDTIMSVAENNNYSSALRGNAIGLLYGVIKEKKMLKESFLEIYKKNNDENIERFLEARLQELGVTL